MTHPWACRDPCRGPCAQITTKQNSGQANMPLTRSKGFGARQPQVQTLTLALASCVPWAGDLTSLSFSFLICDMRLYLFPRAAVNKSPQTWWLKTTDIYHLTVPEAESLMSRYRQGWFLLEGSERESRPCLSPSFSWLQPCLAFLGLWQHNSSGCPHRHMARFPSVCVSKFPSLIRMSVIGLRPTLI